MRRTVAITGLLLALGAFGASALATPRAATHDCVRGKELWFRTADGVKTLLFSPSDVAANAETRYFKRLGAGRLAAMKGRVGERTPEGLLKSAVQRLVAPQGPTVPEWLARIGIRPEAVDYLSYDHLHTQDLRNWLGGVGSPKLKMSDRASTFLPSACSGDM